MIYDDITVFLMEAILLTLKYWKTLEEGHCNILLLEICQISGPAALGSIFLPYCILIDSRSHAVRCDLSLLFKI